MIETKEKIDEIVSAIEHLAGEVKATNTADISLIAIDLIEQLKEINESLYRIATALELQTP
jgi:hypothetical protein